MKKYLVLLTILTMVFVVGCEINDLLDGDSGELALSVADAPVNEIDEVVITLDRIEVKGDDTDWQEFTDFDGGTKTVNLLELRFDEELIGQEELQEGVYEQIRLILSAKEDVQGIEGQIGDSYVSYKGEYEGREKDNLFIPSGQQTGLKIDYEFMIEEGTISEILLDFDVREILKNMPEQAPFGYILSPEAINTINKQETADVEGRVVDQDQEPITDNDVIIDVKNEADEIIGSTVATIEEMDDRAEGAFKLRGLETGIYYISAYVEDKDGNIIAETEEDIEIEIVETGSGIVVNIEENIVVK